MVQVFDRALNRDLFTPEVIANMRAAYLEAADKLDLSDNAERRRLAKIVQKICKLELAPTAAILARYAIDWYISELAAD